VTPDSGLVLARMAALAALLAMAGVPLYLLTAKQALLGAQARKAVAVLAIVSMLASVWWALASVAAMAAMPIAALDRATVTAVLEATPTGAVLSTRLAAGALLIAWVVLSPRAVPAAILALAALASSAWTGHSGAAQGTVGMVQRGLDAVHLGAAALWLGALLVFLASMASQPDRPRHVERLSAFARTGTMVVVVLAVTGSANAFLIGREGWSAMSDWSVLLAAKIALFVAMLGLAAVNRWRLTPALAANMPGAQRRLAVSLTLETGCALAIIALVAVLGLLDPGAT
jgi:putative copper resistance protein D